MSRISWASESSRAAALEVICEASPEGRRALARTWSFWARPDQLPPAGPWRTWLLLGGRGAGKTRAGAEWLRAEVASGRMGRVALIGPTFADVREVMIDGLSGLRSLGRGGFEARYEPSRRRLVWPNGAVAFAFSAEDPDSLRGPQFHGAWLDEYAAWREAETAYDMLQFGLRLGEAPRQVVTTTPRPTKAMRRLLASPGTVVTRAAAVANAAHLAPGFFTELDAIYGRSTLGRQELFGELVEDLAGALWSRSLLDGVERAPPEELDRIVVAVDPPVSEGPGADACGVIVAGAQGVGLASCAWVLADRTVQGASPRAWARRVADTARQFGADRIVVEVNQGGALVRTLLELESPTAPVVEVRAIRGKQARAEPVAALYESGRVFHAARFPALEDEMCSFGAPGAGRRSPDRLDALVWAITALLLTGVTHPRLRKL